MSRPDAARARWEDTKRSALGRAEGHQPARAPQSPLLLLRDSAGGGAETRGRKESPPVAPAAEEQKANLLEPSRRTPPAAEGSALRSRQGSLRRSLPFKSRLEASLPHAPWAPPRCVVSSRPPRPRPSAPPHPPGQPPGRHWGPICGAQAPRPPLPRRQPGAPRRGGPTEASFFVVEMGVVRSRYTLKSVWAASSFLRVLWEGAREGGSVHESGRGLPGVSWPCREHLLCAGLSSKRWYCRLPPRWAVPAPTVRAPLGAPPGAPPGAPAGWEEALHHVLRWGPWWGALGSPQSDDSDHKTNDGSSMCTAVSLLCSPYNNPQELGPLWFPVHTQGN